MVTSCYNVYGNAYYAAFGGPSATGEIVVDFIVEILFFLDMLFCFFQEYKEEETQ